MHYVNCKWDRNVCTLRQLQGDDDGLHDDEDSELEYDALNDETFGGAIKGNWEDLHENLVQLDRTRDIDDGDEHPVDLTGLTSNKHSGEGNRNDFFSLGESLLSLTSRNRRLIRVRCRSPPPLFVAEQDLLRMGLRNMPSANYDDCESRITLDPSVWAPPPPPVTRAVPNTGPGHGGHGNMFGVPDPSAMRGSFPGMFPPQQQPQRMNSGPKMCTLEDIERNMRSQPTPGQSNGHPNNNMGMEVNNLFPPNSGGGSLNAPSRLPPGFGPQQQPPPPGPHMPHNNFGPHPPFPPPMNQQHPQQRHGALQGYPPMMPPMPPSGPLSPNHYNKRLVMEIQQTHPLLAFNRMGHPGMPPPGHPMFLQQQAQNLLGAPLHHHGGMHPMHHPHHPGMPPMQPNHPPHHPGMMNGGHKRAYSPMRGGARDGNLSLTRQLNGEPQDGEVVRDEYRNLMTPRAKQWLIGIQLLQLNTETPYIDDYYYAVYKERLLKGRRENKCHKDNQLNHPFSQPQGHAQLVLQSIGNRNHQNNRNNIGGGGRDRKMSESSRNGGDGKGGAGSQGGGGGNNNDQQQTPRTYTPLQFENSLGKLQCGSVTAPRKIIDMEIMAAEAGSGGGGAGGGNLEVTAQRKCRQMLLHIETLYRVVLKLEDLKNPTAIEAFALLREKKERERKIALDQELWRALEVAAAAPAGAVTPTTTTTPTTMTVTKPIGTAPGGGRLNIDSAQQGDEKGRLGEETLEELLRVLVQGLALEKVVGMMAVRKGRSCLQRAMAQLVDLSNDAVAVAAWQAWCGILMTVPLALKKDREETEVQLLTFASVLKRHVSTADLKQLQVLGQGIETKATVLMTTKVGTGQIQMRDSRIILYNHLSFFPSLSTDWRRSNHPAAEPCRGSAGHCQGHDQHDGAAGVERASGQPVRGRCRGHGGQQGAPAAADPLRQAIDAARESHCTPVALP